MAEESYDEKSLENGTGSNGLTGARSLPHNHAHAHPVTGVGKLAEAEVDPRRVYVERFGRFGSFLDRLFAHGVEARGIERVPEDQREPRRVWNK
jgi:hypothetical protein